MRDWATDLLRNRPLDFNGDILATNDHVLFALGIGRLGEGTVVALGIGLVSVQSLTSERRLTVPSDGVIKISLEE